jgi:hypothetical protein
MNKVKTKSFVIRYVLVFGMLVLLPSLAYAEKILYLSDYGISVSDLTYLEKREGVVMEILRGNRFVLNEKIHFICKETEVNGKPVDQGTLSKIKGSNVKVERYRLKNGAYFVSSISVKQ